MITFFTSGPEESRAWTVEKNTLAPKAASVIHTDFKKNFIRSAPIGITVEGYNTLTRSLISFWSRIK